MRRTPAAVVTALIFAAAPTAADAAVRHIVKGRGFGHGIGMSQYGALGFAKHGRDYDSILRHYYRGTDLSTAETQTIRVLLQPSRFQGAFDGATRASGGRRLNPDRTYKVTKRGGRVTLRTAGGKALETYSGRLRVKSSGGIVRLLGHSINGVTAGRYRDVLEFRATGGGVMAVNAASLDDYVKGVLPGEVPPSWPVEALKAQAVAARSYALATNRGGGVFDQYPDTRSQVYRGADSEHHRSNSAVEKTANEVLRYDGAVIAAFFFSTSGGETENVENVFYGGEPKPYLVSVEDPYDDESPKHKWRFRFSTSRMQSKLGGLVKGRFRAIRVKKRGESPRIVWADIVGSRGRTRVRGSTLRQRLGLYDNWAHFRRIRTEASGSASASGIRGSWLRSLVRPPRLLVGELDPAPANRRVVVERRRKSGGWKAVRRARTRRAGGYRITVSRPGVYRVRAGGDTGPAVTVR